MGNLDGTNVNKIDGGLGRLNSTNDDVILLVGAIPVTGTTLVQDEAITLIQAKDIEDLGVNESFDANNHVLAHYHISEIFRLAPEATAFFLPVAVGSGIEDHTAKIIETVKANQQIKGIGYFGFTNTLETVSDTANSLQSSLVAELKKDHIYIDFVLLEGGSTALAFNSFPNLRELDGQNVSVIIGQDSIVSALDPAYAPHGAIGSALGMLCVRQVSENIGSTDIINKPDDKKGEALYSLTDKGLKKFVSAGLSTGQKISELTNAQLKSLITKGYIFAASYNGTADIFFSGSATCTSKSSDYAYIEYNRVWNKCARLIEEALLPQIKGKVKKDPQTGYIKQTTISSWERVCMKASIERMEAENDISGGSIYINPKQAPTEDTPLKISVEVIADDIVHSFDVDLSLTNKLS